MKAILVIETVMLIGLLGSYLGARSKIKSLEMLLKTYKQIAESRKLIALYERFNNETGETDCTGYTPKEYKEYVQIGHGRPEWCPLRPLPQKNKYDVNKYATVDYENDITLGHYLNKGQNDCLKAITGDTEKLIQEILFGIKATSGKDDYSVGLRNGMRWALSVITNDEEPEFERTGEESKNGIQKSREDIY